MYYIILLLIVRSVIVTWRQTKIIALEKPEKLMQQASSYRSISLLSVCYKHLERTMSQRFDSKIQGLLKTDQVSFL